MSSSSALTTRVIQLMLTFSAAAIVLAIFLARAMTRPLRNMAHAVQHFAESGKELPLPVQRGDEIGLLARAASESHHRIAETLAALESNRSELAHQARHDPLTGIANRMLFTERAELALARARRSDQMLALLIIDLDDFKPVNDTQGHAAGDKVLITIARRMKELVRETDTVARIGGDEFAVLIEGIQAREHVEPVAQKLLEAIAQPVRWKDTTLRVRGSIGINFYPDGGSEFDVLLSGADMAMYRAKTSGSGYAFFN